MAATHFRSMITGVLVSAMLATGLIVCGTAVGVPAASNEPSEATWNSIKDDIFKGRAIADGAGLLTLEAPKRAEDAALVPITVHLTLAPGDARSLRALTLVVDENPAPLAGTFTIGPKAGVTSISTRLRVDTYTYVHAIALLSDDRLYAVKSFVKASGGCSAPAMKSPDEARANMGELKFRRFPPASGAPAAAMPEAQVMLRHPNNTGMQMDQLTRLYIPPLFVEHLKVWQGDELVLDLDGGISISENPSIRFSYVPNGASVFRAVAVDTDKHVFKAEWDLGKV